MTRKRVLVLGDLPKDGLGLLFDQCDVDIRSDGPLSQTQMETLVPGYNGLLTMLTQRVSAAVLAAGDQLEIVSNYAVGVDNIDLEAARRCGVVVTNTPDVLTADTADLTWALILAVVRAVPEAERFLRAGQFAGWEPKLTFGRSLQSLALGVVGAGRIGQAVLERAISFQVKTFYASRTPLPPDREKELGTERLGLPELLSHCEIVSLHTPLTSETRQLLDETALRSMPAGGFLINTARGALIDESALAKVLDEGHLAGVGLDVFEEEPEIEAALLALDNVILLPHIGSATLETRTRMAQCCCEDLLTVLVQGESPQRRVE